MKILIINIYLISIIIENDLMSEIEKLSEEKHLLFQKLSQLEENSQKSSKIKNSRSI